MMTRMVGPLSGVLLLALSASIAGYARTPIAALHTSRSASSRRVAVAASTYDEMDAPAPRDAPPPVSEMRYAPRGRAPPTGTWTPVPDGPDARPEISTYPISPATVAALAARGITHFTPIQTGAFEPAMAGRDILARSRTGTGKTLAFALPIIESIGKAQTGRPRPCQPLAIVLVPTRELAKQVASEFELLCGAHRLSTVAVYGGAPMGPQVRELKSGVHIVVGTPGRILDHINERTLDLSSVRHAVLDEADEMLDMGFADDVASILEGAPPAGSRQMLLFSATTPPFIQRLVKQHMRDELQLDAVGANDGPKTSTTVQHYAVLAPERQEHRPAVLRDVLTVHGRGAKRVIVFTETKRDCDELVTGRQLGTLSAAALHGDVQQQQRETTMKNFREGKFTVLVATDVAARGIDVSGVDLVISYHVPMSTESYVHRSGRTGRAGASGKSIVLYNEGRFSTLSRIERECQFKFHKIGPPAPEAVIAAAAVNLPTLIAAVDPDVVPLFAATARQIMLEAEGKGDLETTLAAALACVAGITSFETRSLITGKPFMRTLQIRGRSERMSVGAVTGILRRIAGPLIAEAVGKVRLCDDPYLAVFDMPAAVASELLELVGAKPGDNVVEVVAEPQTPYDARGQQERAREAEAEAELDDGEEVRITVCTDLPVLSRSDRDSGGGRGGGGGNFAFASPRSRFGGGGGRFGGGGGGGGGDRGGSSSRFGSGGGDRGSSRFGGGGGGGERSGGGGERSGGSMGERRRSFAPSAGGGASSGARDFSGGSSRPPRSEGYAAERSGGGAGGDRRYGADSFERRAPRGSGDRRPAGGSSGGRGWEAASGGGGGAGPRGWD